MELGVVDSAGERGSRTHPVAEEREGAGMDWTGGSVNLGGIPMAVVGFGPNEGGISVVFVFCSSLEVDDAWSGTLGLRLLYSKSL